MCSLQSFYLDSTNLAGVKSAVAMLFIYEFLYCMFLETIAYNYSSEIWPTHMRTYGVALSGSTFYLLQVAYAVPSATAFDNISWKYFIVFIVLTAFATVVAYFTFPETRGKSLEDIAAFFGDTVEIKFDDIRLDNLDDKVGEDGLGTTDHVESRKM